METFRRHGFDVSSVQNGTAAIALSSTVDLVVLGLELPDLDGLEVCRRIRTRSSVPIIATTVRGTGADLVTGLRAGLDAYLIRPYGRRELVARAESILRRTHPRSQRGDAVGYGPLRIGFSTREVHVHGRPVSLTRKEFDLLRLLASEPSTVFSRREIMSAVWKDEWAQSTRTIDTHVSSLRNKLGDPSIIVTVRGVGFRIGLGRRGEVAHDATAGHDSLRARSRVRQPFR